MLKKIINSTVKILKYILLFILGLVILILGIDGYVGLFASQFIYDVDDISHDMQAIVVLGARVTPQKTPSPILRDRLDTAIELYNDNVSKKILVSGDHQTPYYNEVGVMKAYLIDKGVDEQDIMMDHSGLCTYDSMNNATKKFKLSRFVVVTQAYHLKRAVYIGRSMAEVYGVNAVHHPYMQLFKYRLREVLARVKDFAKVNL